MTGKKRKGAIEESEIDPRSKRLSNILKRVLRTEKQELSRGKREGEEEGRISSVAEEEEDAAEKSLKSRHRRGPHLTDTSGQQRFRVTGCLTFMPHISGYKKVDYLITGLTFQP